MKMTKRSISLLMALVMMLTLIPVSAMAATKDNPTITGILEYKQGSVDYRYDDDYFANSAYDYSDDLAEASMGLTLASANGTSEDYSKAPDVLEGYLSSLGFKNFEANEAFTTKPGRDTCGVGIAYKKTRINGEKYTIVAVGIRGAEYESEWASNVKLGRTGDHTGFAEAANISYDYLLQYMKKHTEITGKVKIWAGSHSRGAITANMFAGKLDKFVYNGGKLSKNATLSLDDIYVYCYEPPMGVDVTKTQTSYAGIYNNIHNLINRGDLVTYVGMKELGFSRYGVDHYLPTPSDDSNYEAYRDAALAEYGEFGSGLYYNVVKIFVDTWHNVTVTPNGTAKTILKTSNGTAQNQVQFLEHLSKVLTDEVGSRDYYYEHMEDGLYELMGTLNYVLNGSSMDDFLADLSENMSANASTIIFNALNNKTGLMKEMEELVMQSLRNVGAAEYDADQVNKLVKGIVDFVSKLAKDYPDETATLVLNLVTIISCHIAEYELGWLRALPDGYLADQTTQTNPFTDVKKTSDYYGSVSYLYNHAYMIGSNSQFYPNQSLTKAQLATVIYRMAGRPAVQGGAESYLDNPTGDYSATVAKAIAYCDSQGYVTGKSSLVYGAEEAVTEAEASEALNLYLAENGGTGTLSAGSDSTITRGEFADLVAEALT